MRATNQNFTQLEGGRPDPRVEMNIVIDDIGKRQKSVESRGRHSKETKSDFRCA